MILDKIFIFICRLKNFAFLVVSALGFSLSIVVVRLWGDTERLSTLLLLQSNVVLLSFVFQLGVRASIRLSVYRNRLALSKAYVNIFEVLMLVVGAAGVVTEWLWGMDYYVALSTLVSLTTVELSFAVANGKSKSIAIWSSSNFLATFYPGMMMLYGETAFGYKYDANTLIECIALLCLVFVFLFVTVGQIRKSFKKIRIFLKFIVSSQSYQVGGANNVLMVFFLIQSSVALLNHTDGMNAYADIQVISGIFVLLLSKAMMLYEKNLYYYNKDKLFLFSSLLVIIFLISTSLAIYAHFSTKSPWLTLFAVAFCLNSRIAWGAIVQYLDGARRYVNAISVSALIFYLANFLMVDRVFWVWSVMGLVVLQLVIGVILIIYWENKSESSKVTN